MTKFKVGDKVRFIEDYMDYKKGDIVEVIDFWDEGINYIGKGKSTGCYFSRVELVEPKPTKNQRITALENEVAELKLIVHELRERPQLTTVINNAMQEPSTTNTVGDIIEFEGKQYRKVDREAQAGDIVVFRENSSSCIDNNKKYIVARTNKNELVVDVSEDNVTDYYLVYSDDYNRTPETVDVYELIVEDKSKIQGITIEIDAPKSPNQQRAEIIEKAKAFIEDKKVERRDMKVYINRKTLNWVNAEFIINEKKRTVVCLIRWTKDKSLDGRGVAKCNPNDVFNEHIGKAIALGRALGLDVSEFEQAVQPTFAKGQLIEGTTKEQPSANLGVRTCYGAEGENVYTDASLYGWYHAPYTKIINDTNAIY